MAGWDGVPWWTGGEAEHSDETARLLAYVASQGSEGIIGINDLQVRAQVTPNGTIRVLPGACIIRNRAASATYQSYAARLPTTDSPVTVPPTTSAGGRTDLVIARVENPNVPGEPWQQPGNRADGPYIFTRLIQGVPAGTTDVRQVSSRVNDSAITLARITQPASNSVVTQAMITSLRQMAMPRTKTRVFGHSIIVAEAETLASTATDGEYWPNVAGTFFQVDVPEWATRLALRAEWSQVLVPAGNGYGNVWARVGGNATNAFDTQRSSWDSPGSTNNQRASWSVADDVAIPASMRGTNISIGFKGKITSISATAARPVLDAASSISLITSFFEAPAEDTTDVA